MLRLAFSVLCERAADVHDLLEAAREITPNLSLVSRLRLDQLAFLGHLEPPKDSWSMHVAIGGLIHVEARLSSLFLPEWRNGRRRGLKRQLLNFADSFENSILTRVFPAPGECRSRRLEASKPPSNRRATAQKTAHRADVEAQIVFEDDHPIDVPRPSSSAALIGRSHEGVSSSSHGLAAAQEKGIIHRDLKPENIFVTRDERGKIRWSFGLAKLTQPLPRRLASRVARDTMVQGLVRGSLPFRLSSS